MAAFVVKCSKLHFVAILTLFYLTNCVAVESVKNFRSIAFEQMKSNIFSEKLSEKLDNEILTKNHLNCIEELSAISGGIDNEELWATKIVDAWGKLPSGMLVGNFYDFGAFSECFNIKRNGVLYESKYCLANFTDPHTTNIKVSRFLNRTGITVGICVPASCSLDYLQKFMEIDHAQHMSINLLENTCQIGNNFYKLKTIDWFAIALLSILIFLIVTSTTYDIFCTMYNRKKIDYFLAFSFYTNGKKLFSYEQSQSSDLLHCLNGIRVITTAWIVLYHTYSALRQLPMLNITFPAEFSSKYHNLIVLSALQAVDTFFVLSGLLVSISLLRQLEKTKGRINILMLYFHRYIRLTPLLAVLFLLSMSLMRYLGNGPYWPSEFNKWSQSCERNWWILLLYFQNYMNPTDLCFHHSWYLSTDMQLFIISPAVVYLIYRLKSKSLFIIGALVLSCMICTLQIHSKYDISNVNHPLHNLIVYGQTHARYSVWLIGVVVGYFIHMRRGRTIRIPKFFNFFAWTLSLAVMVAVIIARYPFEQLDSNLTGLEFGLFTIFSRIGWAISLCYIIFACIHNSGGIVNEFLGHPLWQPLSRLSYAIYLFHYPVIRIVIVSFKSTFFYSDFLFYQLFIGIFVLTVFVSIIGSLAVESPVVILEKFLFHAKKTNKTEELHLAERKCLTNHT